MSIGAWRLLWTLADKSLTSGSISSFQSVSLGKLTCCLSARIRIRSGQSDSEAPAVNLKGQTALFVIVGLPAQIGMFCCILCQPLFERGIVRLNFNGFAGFVKIDAGRFLPFGQSGFHIASISACSVKTGAFSRFFVSSTPAKTG
jgi:hypothetical protein